MTLQCPSIDLLLKLEEIEAGNSDHWLIDHVRHCESCQAELRKIKTSGLSGKDATMTVGSSNVTKPIDTSGDQCDQFPIPARYERGKEIGRGGMGLVVRVRDLNIGRELALKTLLPGQQTAEHVERLSREAKVTGRLQHPGVPPVIEFGYLGNGLPFFTMKLIEGETLASRLKRRDHSVPNSFELAELFRGVALTIAYAHCEGVIHRDLKPSNVMIGAFGEVQVMDWGTARILDQPDDDISPFDETVDLNVSTLSVEHDSESGIPDDSNSLTRHGQVMGTLSYMAPEQARGDVDAIDKRADVFGLGAILCEMLTGAPPYRDRNTRKRLSKAMQGDTKDAIEALGECRSDPELIQLCQRCLDPDPAQRLPDGQAVAAEVESYLSSVEHRLRQAEIEQEKDAVRAVESKRRRKLAVGLSLLTVLAIFVGTWFFFQSELRRQRTELEASQQRAFQEQELENLLSSLAELRDASKWEGAELYWSQADQLGKQLGDSFLSERVKNARLDLDLARELEIIPVKLFRNLGRTSYLDVKGRHGQIAQQLNRYLKDRFGVDKDILELSENECNLLKSSPVRIQIVNTLDDWATGLSISNGSLQTEIFEITDKIDDTELSSKVRSLAREDDQSGMARLINETPVSEFRPYTLKLLAESIEDEQLAVSLLTQSELANPRIFYNHIRAGSISKRYTEFYRAGAIAFPDLPDYQLMLANALIVAKRHNEAEATINLALSRFPNSAEAYERLGDLQVAQQQFEKAESSFRRAIELDPTLAALYRKLARELERRSDFDQAEATYRSAILQGGDPHSIMLNYESLLKVQGRADEIESVVSWIVNELDLSAYAVYRQGYALFLREHFESAIRLLDHSIELDPSNPNAIMMRGECLFKLDKIDESIDAFQSRVQMKPPTAAAYRLLAQAYDEKEEFEKAIELYYKSIEIADDANSFISLAERLERLNRIDESKDVLSRMAKHTDSLGRPHSAARRAFEMASRFDRPDLAFRFATNQQFPSVLPPDFKRRWILTALQMFQQIENPEEDQTAQSRDLIERYIEQTKEQILKADALPILEDIEKFAGVCEDILMRGSPNEMKDSLIKRVAFLVELAEKRRDGKSFEQSE